MTLLKSIPAAFKIAFMFSKTLSVCASIPPSTSSPVAGSIAIYPDVYKKPFIMIACEYGPIAFGAVSVFIIVFIYFHPFNKSISRVLKYYIINIRSFSIF